MLLARFCVKALSAAKYDSLHSLQVLRNLSFPLHSKGLAKNPLFEVISLLIPTGPLVMWVPYEYCHIKRENMSVETKKNAQIVVPCLQKD